jgi:hypothetical protein
LSRLELYSEPFARTGNIAAEGFKRLLGRPALGLLQTVVRESIQNCMDAGREGQHPRVLIRLRTLTETQKEVLAKSLISSLPDDSKSASELRGSLEKNALRVLEICDFGTLGLGGPTSADEVADADNNSNFVNFIRNVGAARDTYQGGGTYGYGKTSLYAMSACSTILVDSLASNDNQAVRRFIGCHLGAVFDAVGRDGQRKRFTGRHWWGELEGTDIVQPATDGKAAECSSLIGMPSRFEQDFGTSILILDPLLTSDDTGQISAELIETILWNFWPRLVRSTSPTRRLEVALEIEGVFLELPAPEQFPPLDLFALALEDIREGRESSKPIMCQRPYKRLGSLAISRGMRAERDLSACREGSVIPQQSALIALMRPVELVVKYVQGDAFPDSRYEWAGVFVCSDDDQVEEAFAASEPPAHDDWIPDNLPKGSAKTWVRVALREINDIAHSYAAPRVAVPSDGDSGKSLASTAAALGIYLGASASAGPGRPTRSAVPAGPRSRRILGPDFERLEVGSGGKVFAVFSCEVIQISIADSAKVRASTFLVIDGAPANTDDIGDEFQPHIESINILGSPEISYGAETLVSGNCKLEIRVEMPVDAAIGARLVFVEEEAA